MVVAAVVLPLFLFCFCFFVLLFSPSFLYFLYPWFPCSYFCFYLFSPSFPLYSPVSFSPPLYFSLSLCFLRSPFPKISSMFSQFVFCRSFVPFYVSFFFPVYLFPPLYNLPVFFRPFLSWSSLGIYKGKGERATLPCAMIGAGGSWDKVRWLGRPLCNRHRVTRKAWLSSLFIIVVGHEGVWVMSGFRQVGR